MSDNIESTLEEKRVFPPPPDFAAKALVGSMAEYQRLYRESIDQPDPFWGRMAGELTWFKKWDRALEWNAPNAKWFVGGKTNLSYNCLDRIIAAGKGGKTAIIWEAEPLAASRNNEPETRRITYQQLKDEVCKLANGLKKLGVK